MFPRFPPDVTAMSATPPFGDLTRREVDAVQRYGTVADVRAGRPVPGQRRHPEQFVIVIRGQIAAVTDYGRRRYLWAGDCFGMPAEDETGLGLETFEALTAATLFVMTRREFASLRAECPRLGTRLATQLTDARVVHRVPAPRLSVSAVVDVHDDDTGGRVLAGRVSGRR